MRNSTRSGAHALARVLNTIGLAIVGVIVAYILLTMLEANPDNTVAILIRELAEYFNLGLANLFLIADQIDPDGTLFLRALVKPLVNLIWVAGFVFLAGAAIALWPDATEQRRLAVRYGREALARA